MSSLINLMKGVAMPLFDDYVDFDAEMENIGADTSPVLQTPPLRGAAIFLGIPGHHQIITVAIDCDLRTLLRGIYLRLGAGGRNGHGPRTLR